jgi:4-amino-4-deoxy-L-arabinose transferase-like glycosyltransferase
MLERFRLSLLAAVIFGAHIAFGLPHIGSFVTADEHYWVEERIPQYWSAWSNGKWKKTLINDKPGVSLALVSGPALLLHPDPSLSCQKEEGRFIGCDPTETARLYGSFRLPILLVNAAVLVLIFLAIRVVSGTATSFLASLFCALSPHLLGMSQIVNPDSLLWTSGTAGLFCTLAFLKDGKRRYAAAAVAALTLALLSKYVALILIFFLPVFLVYFRFRDPEFSPVEHRKRLIGLMAISTIPLLLFPIFVPGVLSSSERITAFLSAGTGKVILPWCGYIVFLAITATISSVSLRKPTQRAFSLLISCVLFLLGVLFLISFPTLVIGRLTNPDWEIFTKLPFDIKDLTNSVFHIANPLSRTDIAFLELSPLAYSLTLPVLAGALISIALSTYGFVRPGKRAHSGLPLVLLSFVAVLLLAFAASNVLATPRYVILALPIFAYLAADGYLSVVRIATNSLKMPLAFAKYAPAAVIVILYAVSVAIITHSTPYHTNFSNGLLPKHALIAHSWGYGGYEAAQYLNSLPNSARLTVWSDYYGVCEFFRGTCLTNYHFDQESVKPDYYVLTRRGKIRYLPRSDDWERESGLTAYRHYDDRHPQWELDILGKAENFVKVVKLTE